MHLTMQNLAEIRSRFRDLHQSGCFVIPNPWDVGSARFLAGMGFKALASTSAGFGFSKGLPDSVKSLPRDLVLEHLRELSNATDLPVNADFQSGYADTPEDVAESVRRCAETGVAGISIEDASRNPSAPLYELPEVVERLTAAREALKGSGVLLVGRAECFLTGHPDPLAESIRRIQAYAEAGADVLFVPGVRTAEQIQAVVQSVAPKPVNVLIGWNSDLTVADLADMGVRRISVGSGLARAAWGGLIRAATRLAEGSFDGFEQNATFKDLAELFNGS